MPEHDTESKLDKLRKSLEAKADAKPHPRPVSVMFRGLKVMVEHPKGSVRSGVDRRGHKWSTQMKAHYGFCSRRLGIDGEYLDVYLGDDEKAPNAYIVNQNDPYTGNLDEQKCILGVGSIEEAKKLYLSHYNQPDYFRSITEMPFDTFSGMANRAKPGGIRWKRRHARERRDADRAIFSAEEPMSKRLSFDEMKAILNEGVNFDGEEVIPAGGRQRSYDEEEHRRDPSGKFTQKGGGGSPKNPPTRRYSVHPGKQSGYVVVDTLSGNRVVASFPNIVEAETSAASRNSRQHAEE